MEPTETPTVFIAKSSGGGGTQADDSQPEVEQPSGDDSGDSQVLEGGNTANQCLPGTWRADHESFAGYLENAFESPAGGAIDFEFQTGNGDLFLVFTPDGKMSMSSQDFQIDMQIVGLASFTFAIEADGSAEYAADDQAIAVWNVDYGSIAEGEGGVPSLPKAGARSELTITPDRLFGYAESEGYTLTVRDAPPGTNAAPYECYDDTLILGPEGFQPVRWERVPE